MKKIVIITKVIVGVRPYPFGFDGGVNLFKKSLSRRLEESLNENFRKNNMDYIATVDGTHESVKEIINSGAYKILISPYVKENVNLEELDRSLYYILSEEEFNNSFVDNILEYLK